MEREIYSILNKLPKLESKLNYDDIKFTSNGKKISKESAYHTTFKDFNRSDFVINGKEISSFFTNMLTKIAVGTEELMEDLIKEAQEEGCPIDLEQVEFFYTQAKRMKEDLVISSDEEGLNYRQFLIEAFKIMFHYSGGETPDDLILEELITNCNQAAYQAFFYIMAGKNGILVLNPEYKTINITCTESKCVEVKIDLNKSVVSDCYSADNIARREVEGPFVSTSLEFKLNCKEEVKYEDGKLAVVLLAISDRSLFIEDIIKCLLYLPNILMRMLGITTTSKALTGDKNITLQRIYNFQDNSQKIYQDGTEQHAIDINENTKINFSNKMQERAPSFISYLKDDDKEMADKKRHTSFVSYLKDDDKEMADKKRHTSFVSYLKDDDKEMADKKRHTSFTKL